MQLKVSTHHIWMQTDKTKDTGHYQVYVHLRSLLMYWRSRLCVGGIIIFQAATPCNMLFVHLEWMMTI